MRRGSFAHGNRVADLSECWLSAYQPRPAADSLTARLRQLLQQSHELVSSVAVSTSEAD